MKTASVSVVRYKHITVVESGPTTPARQRVGVWTDVEIEQLWSAKQAWRVSQTAYRPSATELCDMQDNPYIRSAFEWRRQRRRGSQNFGRFARDTLRMQHRSEHAITKRALLIDKERRPRVRYMQVRKLGTSKTANHLKQTSGRRHMKQNQSPDCVEQDSSTSWRSSSRFAVYSDDD